MNIDFRPFIVAVILNIWLLLNITFIFQYFNIIGTVYWLDPFGRPKAIKRLIKLGVINFLILSVLFLLKFKFWYICLIFTDGLIFFACGLIFLLIYAIIFYVFKTIKGIIKNNKTEEK